MGKKLYGAMLLLLLRARATRDYDYAMICFGCIEATGASIDWEPAHAGAGAIPIHGAPLPEPTLP